jgi:hypothetical protein
MQENKMPLKLAIASYEPTTDEIEAEARVFKKEDCECGPLHALLVQRIRFNMLETEYRRIRMEG